MLDKNKLFRHFYEQKDLMDDRITHGIEQYRKGWFKINFTDKAGQPLKGAKVTVRQKSHAFQFGCNIFKLGCFPEAADNALYEQKFSKLFNLAIAPLYWDDFEPEDGVMRFEKDSVFIDRRIPPELVLEFCQKHGIAVKGHPLYWQVFVPDWLPKDYEQVKHFLTRRLQKLAERYDGVFDSFDCINEVTSVPLLDCEPHKGETHYRNFNPLSGNYAHWMFDQANRFFHQSKLVLNETDNPWSNYKKELSHYYLLAEGLLQKGSRIDEIGLQYHNFRKPDDMYSLTDSYYNPSHLYKVMDCYGKLGRPLSVTEITVPGYEDEVQAETLHNLYRIWFSAQHMNSIVYWNLGDNCAISRSDGWAEDQYKSGLTDNRFEEKQSYKVLDRLINHEWRTNLDLEANDDNAYFKAFYGDYEVTVTRDGKQQKRDLRLSKNGYDEFYFVIED